MKSRTFGLDIDSTSIKAVWLGKNGNAINLESIVSAPISSKVLISESVLDQQTLSNSINNMLSSAGIDIADVNIALPENQVFSKILELPQLSDQELQAALKWELEQHVPLPLDEVKTDWQVLEIFERDGKQIMHVLVVSSPISLLNKYDKILQIAGLVPQTVETEIISVHRSVLPILNNTAADVIVHVGSSTTDVILTNNKIINIIFPIPLGGAAITRAIATDLGIDDNQAENFKRAYGLNQDMFEGKVGKSLAPILESIIGDIKKAILLFKEKNNSTEIKQIVLCGAGALLPGIDLFFTNAFGVQVGIGNPWQINNITNVPPEVLQEATAYNVALGLALRDIT